MSVGALLGFMDQIISLTINNSLLHDDNDYMGNMILKNKDIQQKC